MAVRAELELLKATGLSPSMGVGGAGMAEESRLTDEMAALQEEAAAASRQRRIRREAGANEDVATVTAAAPPGSPVATAAAAVGLNISLLYQTSRASLVAEIRELEAEVAQRTAPPRGEAAATTAGGREEVEARLAEAEAALERERGALAVQAKALQEETLQASPRPPPPPPPPPAACALAVHTTIYARCHVALHRRAWRQRTALPPASCQVRKMLATPAPTTPRSLFGSAAGPSNATPANLLMSFLGAAAAVPAAATATATATTPLPPPPPSSSDARLVRSQREQLTHMEAGLEQQQQAFRAVINGLEGEVLAWRSTCAAGEGALGREVSLLERESIPREAAEAIRQSAGRAKEALASERAKGGRLEAELLAGRVAMRRKEEEVATLSHALEEAGVQTTEDSAAAAVAAAAGAVAEKKGRGLKLGSMKIGSKKVEAIKNLSAELNSSKQLERETEREVDGLLGQLSVASAANEDLDAQLQLERQALTQARAEARDATEAQRQAADLLVQKDKEAALLTEQLQGLILQQKAVSERAVKAATPRKTASGLIAGFSRG